MSKLYLRPIIKTISTHQNGWGASQGKRCKLVLLSCWHSFTIGEKAARTARQISCCYCGVEVNNPDSPLAATCRREAAENKAKYGDAVAHKEAA